MGVTALSVRSFALGKNAVRPSGRSPGRHYYIPPAGNYTVYSPSAGASAFCSASAAGAASSALRSVTSTSSVSSVTTAEP